MMTLPRAELLLNRCKALAALDLILSPEWEYRRYSFNARWSDGERMASMRDGCGDEWWIVFHRDGWAAVKGLAHESAAWDHHHETISSALQRSFPASLHGFSTEPAFRWDATSFAYFNLAAESAGWVCANERAGYATEETGDVDLFAHVLGTPADYVQFAAEYYEVEVPESLVAAIFALEPITTDLLNALNASASLEEIAEELYGEIQYPRAAVA